MAVDWTKPIQTRDGRKVEFLREINDDTYQMVCLVVRDDGSEFVNGWTRAGKYIHDQSSPSDLDIINTPEPSPVDEEVVTMYSGVWKTNAGGMVVAHDLHSTATRALEDEKSCVGVAEIRVRMKR